MAAYFEELERLNFSRVFQSLPVLADIDKWAGSCQISERIWQVWITYRGGTVTFFCQVLCSSIATPFTPCVIERSSTTLANIRTIPEIKLDFILLLEQQFIRYTPIRYKRYYLFHYLSLTKSSENRFYFFACILPDYVAYERPKEFWKNSQFENMRTGFLVRC